HERYVRSITAILNWERAPETAILQTKKALAILEVHFLCVVVDGSREIFFGWGCGLHSTTGCGRWFRPTTKGRVLFLFYTKITNTPGCGRVCMSCGSGDFTFTIY